MDDQRIEQTDDADAFAAAQLGQEWALRALWESHRRYVAVVLIAHKPNTTEVDDLLQDVAAALISKISTVRTHNALRPWLRMVALNAARLAGRKLVARPVQSLDNVAERAGGFDALASRPARDDVGGRQGPAANVQTHQDSGWMMCLLQRLPEDYREPLLMRCVHEMSYRQIGEVMGLPETTIETRIARGRRMLRELVHTAEAAELSRCTPTPRGIEPEKLNRRILP